MPSTVYPSYRQALLAGTVGYDLDNDTVLDGVYCALIDATEYIFNAGHAFYSDLSGIVADGQRITSPTVLNGTLKGGNLVFLDVTGPTVQAFVLYRRNPGSNTTWPLVLYYEQPGGGLPLVPNGGDITVQWSTQGIFTL